MAKANGVRWHGIGHKVRRDDDNFLKRALMLDVNEQRKRGRPKQTWRRQDEENVKRTGLEGGGCESDKIKSGSESDC